MKTTRSITVRWSKEGWHNWPEAEGVRDYLASRHRHIFHYELTVSVEHNDREVEFHDLLTFARAASLDGELGRTSCESLAELVLTAVQKEYRGREYSCTVWEDNEVGATITWTND